MDEITLSYNGNRKFAFIGSLIVAGLLLLISVLGILDPLSTYGSELIVGNLATDWTTLGIVLPLLLGSMWAASRGKTLGLLLWPGCLLYLIYVYLFYSFTVPFSWTFLPYILLTSLSIYSYIGIVIKIDSGSVKARFSPQVKPKLAGWVLLVFGIGFTLLNLADIFEALSSPAVVDQTIVAPWIVDFTVGVPLMILGGILLLRKKELGYVIGPGLLLYVGILDLGVSILYLFYWIYEVPEFEVVALIIFVAVAVICFIPLSFFFKRPQSRKSGA